jgi:zinc protease
MVSTHGWLSERRLRAIALLAIAGAVSACASTRPERSMAVTAEDGRLLPLDSVTISYTVGGVRVIHRPNFANDVVAARLYLLGGTRQLTPSTQGVELLLLQASEYGTAKYPGDEARAAWARTGSQLTIDPSADWTMFGFRGIRQEFDSSWNVFADRLMRPTLNSRDVTLVRDRAIARIRQWLDNPDGYVTLVADSVAFAGHPYGLQPGGTEASLVTLDSAALAKYLAEQMVTSRMLLVVVGNVGRDQVESAVTRTLATLPGGSYVWTLPPPFPRTASSVAMFPRAIATNYVLGYFDGPAPSDPDWAAFRVATALLSSRINYAVREQRGLSYAASAPFIERGFASGGVYVTTTAPARVLPIIKAQVDSIRRLPAESLNMRYFTDQFVLEYLAENMTNSAQADFLARAELYRGDYRKATQAMEEIRNVTGSRVRVAAARYFSGFRFVYLGDTTRAPRAAFTSF